MNHLNEDKLIRYAFDLMGSEAKDTAQKHLDDCGDCRNALDEVRAKFAVMNVLDADEAPADELIARTLADLAQQPEAQGCAAPCDTKRHMPNIIHRVMQSGGSRRSAFAMAAAAVLIICFLLLDYLPNPQVKEPSGISKGVPFAVNSDSPQPKPTAPFPDDRMALLSSEAQNSVGMTHPTEGVRIVSADEIPDVPPFAPASAIELVVLPKPDKSQVTIYNSKDLTLVRDTRKLTLKLGWNWIQFMWANTQIDPTSLSLTPLKHADKVDIQLISYPARLKDIGRWLIRSEVEGAVPFEITYFASGLSWRAFYMGTMNEDETTMNLKGYVNVANNSGQDFKNTQTRLIVGETRLTEEIPYLAQRHYPYGPDIVVGYAKEINFPRNWKDISKRRNGKVPLLGDRPRVSGRFRNGDVGFDGESFYHGYAVKAIEKTGLSEYFLYTIEGTEDLTNQWTKRLPSFDVADIPVKSLYKYDDTRYGKQAVRFVSFANDTEHELGETPIPEGAIKIYRNVNEQKMWHGHPGRESETMRHSHPGRESRAGSPCHLSYIGGSAIKYIPVNEDIELNLGPARLVKVEPTLMETKTENHTFDTNGNINGWDNIESYKVTITNTRDIPIDIEITWNMGTDAWELELDNSVGMAHPTYKKHDKSRARFTMTVPARSEKVFSHTIRKYRQNRIETYVEKQKDQKK